MSGSASGKTTWKSALLGLTPTQRAACSGLTQVLAGEVGASAYGQPPAQERDR